ncbi:MAG: metal-dependent hydrolase [Treponema sp.]|jgi:inner membrane protein|nr:metal-dependent hydrolase [Treponema sp.]
MDGYTHMIIGGLSGAVPVAISIAEKKFGFSLESQHVYYPLIGVLPAVAGSLGPDIDLPNSKSGRALRLFLKSAMTLFGVLSLSLAVYVCFIDKLIRPVNVLFPVLAAFALVCLIRLLLPVARHRKGTHSGLALLIILLPVLYIIGYMPANLLTSILFSIWFGFCMGWISHLVADTFNRKGVPWLYPLDGKLYHIANIVTGSKRERSFRKVCVVVFSAVYLAILLYV